MSGLRVTLKCQSCGHVTFRVLDLGSQPICNRFLGSIDKFREEELYPLRLTFCENCTLAQLEVVPPNSVTFGKGFNYLTGVTPDAVEYFKNLATRLVKELELRRGDVVLDIGSNDGTFLRYFKEAGMDVVGVDPAPEPSSTANNNGIRTINKRFEDAIDELRKIVAGKLKIVTAINVAAHTDRIHEFLDGVYDLCSRNRAFFVSQSQYLPELMERVEWDTIYHEHARYYTVYSFDRLLLNHGLVLYDTERSPYYGGSFLAFASPRSMLLRRTARLIEMEASERRFSRTQTFLTFAARVRANRRELGRLLRSLKKRGAHIVGIGAPMKSSTLLNYCHIDGSIIDYLTEVNPLKIGTYSPGMHIQVVPEEVVFNNQPDYALILAWNFAERIMETFRRKGFNGKFILPLPEVKVIEQ